MTELIRKTGETLDSIESKVETNGEMLANIETNKAVVMASTRDFQETCMVILNREHVLTCVVSEIEKHQKYYLGLEEC